MAVELYDEHEQSERVRAWIKEYSASIIIGLILAFAGIFGFRQWQDHRAEQRVLAADYFQLIEQRLAADDLEAAAAEYQAMRDSVGKGGYVGLAGMRLAAARVDAGRLGEAENIYRAILDDRSLRSLRPVATLRLARVLEAQGEYEEALGLLDGEAPTGFEASWAEARGDLLFERGRLAEARSAWERARDLRVADGGNVRLLQVKIETAAATAGETS